MIEMLKEQAGDTWEVENLYDLCFVPGRQALSSYRLREDVLPLQDLCLVARDEAGILAGAVRSWPVQVAGKDIVLFGPVAVHPTRQGEGLGAYLIYHSIEIARNAGWKRMMLVGDASYYGRFGFDRLEGITMPPPTNLDRVLGMSLVLHAWKGVQGKVQKANNQS